MVFKLSVPTLALPRSGAVEIFIFPLRLFTDSRINNYTTRIKKNNKRAYKKQFYCIKNTRANPEISSLKVLLSVCLLVYFTAEVLGKDLRPLLAGVSPFLGAGLPVTTNSPGMILPSLSLFGVSFSPFPGN